MAISKLTCKLFKLTGITSLDDIEKNIISKSYAEALKISIKDTKKAKALSEQEKNFYFTWEGVSEPNEIILNEANEESDEIFGRYLFATANIEYTKKKRRIQMVNFFLKQKELTTLKL